jgi:hypothetical protein
MILGLEFVSFLLKGSPKIFLISFGSIFLLKETDKFCSSPSPYVRKVGT